MKKEIMKREIVVLLDNIRSSHNVGSIFRTADGAGVSKIILSGYTPAPIDRFGRESKEIAKTSLGASDTVPWEAVTNEDALATLARYKQDGFEIVSVEQHQDSISIYDYKPTAKTLYIFGNEIDGVSQELLQASDKIIEIPMKGKKESLNVSVTTGVALFQNSLHS